MIEECSWDGCYADLPPQTSYNLHQHFLSWKYFHFITKYLFSKLHSQFPSSKNLRGYKIVHVRTVTLSMPCLHVYWLCPCLCTVMISVVQICSVRSMSPSQLPCHLILSKSMSCHSFPLNCACTVIFYMSLYPCSCTASLSFSPCTCSCSATLSISIFNF